MKKNILFKKMVIAVLSVLVVFSSIIFISGCEKDNNDSQKEIVFTIEKTDYKVSEDTSFEIEVNASDSATITWASSDRAIADVTDGLVRAKNIGTCVISATCGNKVIECNVEVIESEEKTIVLESQDYAIKISDKTGVKPCFNVYYIDEDGTKKEIEGAEISYTLTGKIVKFSDDGYLVASTSNKYGTVQLKAEYEGEIAYADVTVYKDFISTESQWNTMLTSSALGEFYLLTNDLDFSGTEYKALRSSSKKFYATVHGNGHVIKNVTLDSGNNENISLFGYIQNGKVYDLTFENVCFKGTGNAYGLSISTESGAEFSDISLDLEFSDSLSGVYVLDGNSNGTFKNILMTINAEDVVSVFNYHNSTCENVYMFAKNGVLSSDDINSYTKYADFVWDINSDKPFDVSIWNYLGEINLPILITK